MKNIIEIKNLNFSYNDHQILKNINLNLEEHSFTTILGSNNSGKSTLIKLILGLEHTENKIKIDKTILTKETISDIKKQIGVVFENTSDQLLARTVEENINFALDNARYPKTKRKKQINNIANKLNIESILKKEIRSLSGGEKQKVALACALVIEPKILILDEAFTMIENKSKAEILKILKNIHKNEKITIIMVTNDANDCLLGDKIVLMKDGTIIKEGTTEEVCKEEKIFRQIGLELPFMVDLSIKLQYYGLIDKIIYDMNEMVDTIWK